MIFFVNNFGLANESMSPVQVVEGENQNGWMVDRRLL